MLGTLIIGFLVGCIVGAMAVMYVDMRWEEHKRNIDGEIKKKE